MNYLPHCDRLEHRCEKVVPIVSLSTNTCPKTLESLTSLLIRDLPSYTNRLIQRRRKRTDEIYSSVITAGNLEFKPIAITSREYPPLFPQANARQVFLTTLEQQYTGIRSAEIQQFHWLFLVETRLGWRLVNMYSRTGISPLVKDAPIAPPTESSRSIVGEAIRIWLNDCHFGKVASGW